MSSNPGKFLPGMLIAWCTIFIFKSGYDFGQFLFALFH